MISRKIDTFRVDFKKKRKKTTFKGCFSRKNRKNRKNRKIRIFHSKITETEIPKTETESETLATAKMKQMFNDLFCYFVECNYMIHAKVQYIK